LPRRDGRESASEGEDHVGEATCPAWSAGVGCGISGFIFAGGGFGVCAGLGDVFNDQGHDFGCGGRSGFRPDLKNIVERREVSLGAANDNMRIIAKGVSADDWIVVGSVGGVKEVVPGTHVRRRITNKAKKPRRLPEPYRQHSKRRLGRSATRASPCCLLLVT
jgi:hypothetical protein